MSILKQKFFPLLTILVVFSFVPGPTHALTYTQLVAAQTGGQVLGASTLYAYPSGSLVNDGGTFYFISGTTKIPFTNWAAFVGLGYSSRNVIKGDLQNYTLSQSYAITTANDIHPWGSWLLSNGTVYYSTQDGMIAVPSWAIFLNNGGAGKFIVKANKYDIAALNAAPGVPPLTLNDPRIAAQSAAPTVPQSESGPTPTPPITPTPSAAATPTPIPTAAGIGASVSPSSPLSQYVLSGSSGQAIATYHITASSSNITIQELDFNVIDSSPYVISSVTANGVSGAVVNNSAAIVGMYLQDTNGPAGLDIPITASYYIVGPTSMPSNQHFTLDLVRVVYTTPGAYNSITANVNAVSNQMDLVATAPSLGINTSSNSLVNGMNQVAQVVVSAGGSGGVVLNTFGLTVSDSGRVSRSGSHSRLRRRHFPARPFFQFYF